MSLKDPNWATDDPECIQTSEFTRRLNRKHPPKGGLPTYTGPVIYDNTFRQFVAQGIGEITCGNGVKQISNMVMGKSEGPGVMIGKDGTKNYGLYEDGYFCIDREKSEAEKVESLWIAAKLVQTDKTIPDAK
jgi:hypothetical protein